MKGRSRIPYSDLPKALADVIPEPSLVRACLNPEMDAVVVWTRPNGLREQEFSLGQGRFLTRVERERALPATREFSIPDQHARVVQGAYLLPESDIRYESYVVHDERRDQVIAECGQEFFTPVYREPEKLIADAVRRARLPYEYRTQWSPSERVSHWVLWLHRGRRWAGEDGHDEDAAFTPEAWRHMREIDPDIEKLLPEIIDELARMWMTDPDRMLAEFRRRVGAGDES